jgi:hypothetical protein
MRNMDIAKFICFHEECISYNDMMATQLLYAQQGKLISDLGPVQLRRGSRLQWPPVILDYLDLK